MKSHARFQKRSATSRAGARHADTTLGLRQAAVLGVIVAKGGATIAEIKTELGIDASTVSGRIAELRDDYDYIADSGEKRAVVSPVAGVVWRLTEKGAQYAKGNVASSLHGPTVADQRTTDLIKGLPLFGVPL